MDKLPVNWFDGTVLVLLVIGVFRGRKNGMSREFLPLFKWVTLVLVSGSFTRWPPSCSKTRPGWARRPVMFGAICWWRSSVIIVFMVLKRLLAYRMGENNFFGGGEYYLGMMSGVIRFACMVLAVLALLNAPYYSQADIKAHKAYVKRWFGGGMYDGNYFPDLQTVQESGLQKILRRALHQGLPGHDPD